ncbi:MAG: AAA family ATPase [Nitrospirae bacterium]|nr:AAA family ATPase [Nitrospirota bacterium]
MTVLYQEYFGLKEPPFSIAPDPRYLFMSEQHREALAHLTFGIGSDGGFILLTGDVGTGKTTVSRCLLDQMLPETHIAFVLNPRVSVEELLAVVCDELGIAYPEGAASNKMFIDRINDFLLASCAQGHKTVLIIEEAQNLSPDVLEQVRLLTNLETNQYKLLQIILLGQPELREMLSRPEMSQLEQRITARYHLGPLSLKDVDAYVSHRLAIGGVDRQLFPSSLIPTLYRLSRGVPRLINLICDRSLLGAYVQGKDKVDKATLKKAAQEVFGREEEGGQRLKAAGWIAAGIVLLAVVAAIAAFSYKQDFFQPAPQPLREVQEKKTESLPLPVALHWPPEQSLDRSEAMTYQGLFKQWGSSYKVVEINAVCRQAASEGLQCLKGLSDLKRLVALNRPSVLKLIDDNGSSFYALLKAVQGQRITLLLADRELTVDPKELEKKWLGEYTLFWKAPPSWRGEIRPGETGRHLQWLAQLIAKKTGISRFGLKKTYDEEMVKEIKKFQLEEGLVPDGRVGVHTVIHLNSRYGVGEPLLSRGGEGI